MKAKFNLEAHKAELRARNEEMQNELDYLRSLPKSQREDNFYTLISRLERAISHNESEIESHYMCEYCYSDRHAYEIIRWETANRIVVRRLIAHRTDHNYMSECQDYSFEPNPKDIEITLRRHKNGYFYEAKGCNPFGFTEEPHEYFDYSF